MALQQSQLKRTTSFQGLKSIIAGTIIQYAKNRNITTVLLDSRNIHNGTEDSIFFAIPGSNHDGHDYITDAYKQGIRQFVVSSGEYTSYAHLQGANIIKVSHTITALQQLVIHHRRQFNLPVLAITGSNGKTIVKEWLSKILATQYNVISSPQSYNSQVGVPLAVSRINKNHTYAIFEAGISRPHEMGKIAPIIQPQIGIFTNIGTAHDGGFTSQQQKTIEKAQLFLHCKKIYYCADHLPINQVVTQLYKNKKVLVTWSLKDQQATYYVQTIQNIANKATKLLITNQWEKYSFHVPFQQVHFLENVIHCIVFLLHEGVSPASIQKKIATLDAVPMRLSLKRGINNCQVIDDTYNNDLAGLQMALDFLSQQQHGIQKTVILSDLLQTGIPPAKLYQKLARLLVQKKVTRLVGIGQDMQQHATLFCGLHTTYYNSTIDFLQSDLYASFKKETILIKGAREFQLERVVAALQHNMHQTVLEVNLGAISHNLTFFRRKINKKTKLMVMVKAATYGSSTFELAKLLAHHKVDYLAVAYTNEGILLREHGITLPIMVMSPTIDSFYKLADYELEPAIYSLFLLEKIVHFLLQHKKNMGVHLKLETGMHRLGVPANELTRLITTLQQCPYAVVKSIYSHLAAAESPLHDSYTQAQGVSFTKMAHRIEEELSITTIKHLLNTNGILRFPTLQYEMVRLGIGLYGVGTEPIAAKELKIATTLKTVISQIKWIAQGTTIGYGRAGIATHDMSVATIAIGYADGFRRSLGNGIGYVSIHGKKAPTIGNICMDMSMIDVTDMDVAVGDEVIIFGQELPVEEIAQAANTIAYEILTNISERIKRVYYIG